MEYILWNTYYGIETIHSMEYNTTRGTIDYKHNNSHHIQQLPIQLKVTKGYASKGQKPFASIYSQ
jgi:hypothetical protein